MVVRKDPQVAKYKKKLKSKHGITLGKLLGYGSEGYVYQISKQRVAKLTDNWAEAALAKRLMKYKKLPSFLPKIYKVIELSNPYGYDWVIVREPLEDLPEDHPEDLRECLQNELVAWCQPRNLIPTDTHYENIGIRKRKNHGDVVLRDLGGVEPLDKYSVPTEPWNKKK